MQRYDALTRVLTQPNSHSVGVMKLIADYYPSFAKRVFHKNPLMEKMAMANFSSMDILLYPICGRCESLAAYCRYAMTPEGLTIRDEFGKGIGVCRCFRCGSETVNPITFYEWCLMELKKKAPITLEDDLLFAVDVVAERLMNDAKRIYVSAREKEKFYDKSE